MSDWDRKPPDAETLRLVIGMGKHAILWGGNYYDLNGVSGYLVWDKQRGATNFADCELAWTNIKTPVRIFRWRWNGLLQENMKRKEKRLHRTMKPLALMKWCLSFVPDARTIIDPFMGSGTTLRAAKDLCVKSVGIEIDEKCCETAVERLRQESLLDMIEKLDSENSGRAARQDSLISLIERPAAA